MSPEKESKMLERIKAYAFPVLISIVCFFMIQALNKLANIETTITDIRLAQALQDGKNKLSEQVVSFIQNQMNEMKENHKHDIEEIKSDIRKIKEGKE